MRDRLIEILDAFGEDISFCDICERSLEDCEACKNEQLANYLLENGVIRLPCIFLQKVYVLPTIENNLSDITEMKCLGFSLSHDSYNVNLITDKKNYISLVLVNLVKLYFLREKKPIKH